MVFTVSNRYLLFLSVSFGFFLFVTVCIFHFFSTVFYCFLLLLTVPYCLTVSSWFFLFLPVYSFFFLFLQVSSNFFQFLPVSFFFFQYHPVSSSFLCILLPVFSVSSRFFLFHLIFSVSSSLFFKFNSRSLALITLALFAKYLTKWLILFDTTFFSTAESVDEQKLVFSSAHHLLKIRPILLCSETEICRP